MCIYLDRTEKHARQKVEDFVIPPGGHFRQELSRRVHDSSYVSI